MCVAKGALRGKQRNWDGQKGLHPNNRAEKPGWAPGVRNEHSLALEELLVIKWSQHGEFCRKSTPGSGLQEQVTDGFALVLGAPGAAQNFHP